MKRYRLITLFVVLIMSVAYYLTAADGIYYRRAPVSNEAYNATTWNGVTGIAPSKDAVRDKIESISIGDVSGIGDCASGACYDGSSDGGTYVRLYDGTSAYISITGGVRTVTLLPSNTNAEGLTITFGDNNNAVALGSGTGASVSINGNAGTASALAADPSDCAALGLATGIGANGNLVCGYAIGTDVQAYSAALLSLAGLTETNGGIPYGTADNAYAWLAAGAEGTLLMGNGAGAPSWLGAGTGGYFLIAAGAADPVWTSQPTLAALEALTLTQGGILYSTAADTPAVLAKGTANQVLQMNSGATAPEWTSTLALSLLSAVPATLPRVDGSAALSLSAAQVSGTVIRNTGQALADVNHTLPQAAAGYNFIAYVGTTLAATNYWRFTADASPQDYMCLDGTCGKLYVSVDTPTMGDTLTCYTEQMSGTGLKNEADLGIGTSAATSVKNTVAVEFDIAGTGYSKAIAETAPGNDVIPQNKYGAVGFEIGADGTIDAIEATDNATGYDSAALAIAGIPAVAASHTRLGTVTAMKSDGAFTFGTTELSAANTTVAYTDATVYTPSFGWVCITGKGTWSTD